jgi:hypothetical protein
MQKRTEAQIGEFADHSAQTIREKLTSRLRSVEALSDVRLRDDTRELATVLDPPPPTPEPESDMAEQPGAAA